MRKIRALVLLSGGLDSCLAALLVRKQGIKLQGLVFKSLFFHPQKVQEFSRKFKIPLKTIDISLEHLQVVKTPSHGYGKRMNPCLDCHLLLLKKAKEILKKEKYDFIITGEVLGQRPFSQNKKALETLEKESGLEGLIVRPLSARLLSLTIPEKKGWLDRDKLLALQGRSRKKQLALAEKYGLQQYSAPGASCILTDPQFSQRLKNLLTAFPQAQTNDIQLLKLGRHFWESKKLIVVGRNEQENNCLKKIAQKGDIILELKDFPGPLVLVRNYGLAGLPAVNSIASKLAIPESNSTPGLKKSGVRRMENPGVEKVKKNHSKKGIADLSAIKKAKQLLLRYAHLGKYPNLQKTL